MSIEIRFWDTANNKYCHSSVQEILFLKADGAVLKKSFDGSYYETKQYPAHFYKDGKRIDK